MEGGTEAGIREREKEEGEGEARIEGENHQVLMEDKEIQQ